MKAICRILEEHTSSPPRGRWGAMHWRPGDVRTLFRWVRAPGAEGPCYEWGTNVRSELAYRIPAEKVEVLEVLDP